MNPKLDPGQALAPQVPKDVPSHRLPLSRLFATPTLPEKFKITFLEREVAGFSQQVDVQNLQRNMPVVIGTILLKVGCVVCWAHVYSSQPHLVMALCSAA